MMIDAVEKAHTAVGPSRLTLASFWAAVAPALVLGPGKCLAILLAFDGGATPAWFSRFKPWERSWNEALLGFAALALALALLAAGRIFLRRRRQGATWEAIIAVGSLVMAIHWCMVAIAVLFFVARGSR